MTTETQQERRPIYIHQDLDDLDITIEAFRVYTHLARRAGKDNFAWPSYTSIGEHCFRHTYPKAQSASLRRKAIRAIAELEELGIISVQRRKTVGPSKKGNTSNAYKILPLSRWKRSSVAQEDLDGEDAFKEVFGIDKKLPGEEDSPF